MPKSKFAFYFDIANFLIIFMQIRYIEVFDLTNAFPRSLGICSSLNRGSTVVILEVITDQCSAFDIIK